jgi:hypothetical protein
MRRQHLCAAGGGSTRDGQLAAGWIHGVEYVYAMLGACVTSDAGPPTTGSTPAWSSCMFGSSTPAARAEEVPAQQVQRATGSGTAGTGFCCRWSVVWAQMGC